MKANGFWPRFRGLMGVPDLPQDHALLICHCASVHTFFMRFALDLVYLDREMRIVKFEKNVLPWRISWGGRKAKHTLEMLAGGIERFGLIKGATVDLSEHN